MPQFQVRSFENIIEEAISYFVGENPTITDFNKGSIVRTLLEAFAMEQSRLYLGMLIGINESIEQSAYTTFGFGRLPAARAYGTVVFTRNELADPQLTTIVPKGTVVSVDQSPTLRYETTADLQLTATSPMGKVIVVAATPGAASNVAAGRINAIQSFQSDLSEVTNPATFTTGSDDENDLERRERFRQFLVGLHRSTKSAIVFGLETASLLDDNGYAVERVVSANTIEVSPGNIACYIYNGAGNTSLDLVTEAAKVLAGYRDQNGVHEGWKAAGIRAQVFAATEVPQDVLCSIDVQDGYLIDVVITTAKAAIFDFFNTLGVGDTLRVESLKQVVRTIPGVLDIHSWDTPADNVTALSGQIILAGDLQMTATDATGASITDVVIGQ